MRNMQLMVQTVNTSIEQLECLAMDAVREARNIHDVSNICLRMKRVYHACDKLIVGIDSTAECFDDFIKQARDERNAY